MKPGGQTIILKSQGELVKSSPEDGKFERKLKEKNVVEVFKKNYFIFQNLNFCIKDGNRDLKKKYVKVKS